MLEGLPDLLRVVLDGVSRAQDVRHAFVDDCGHLFAGIRNATRGCLTMGLAQSFWRVEKINMYLREHRNIGYLNFRPTQLLF